mgnify:CR=1 FL=1
MTEQIVSIFAVARVVVGSLLTIDTMYQMYKHNKQPSNLMVIAIVLCFND